MALARGDHHESRKSRRSYTGGNSGIGFATARRFHELGAHVAILARSADKASEAAEAIGDGVVGVAGDVAETRDLERFYATVAETWGRVDYVVANAGVAHPRPLEHCNEAYFDQMCGVNFRGSFFTVQKALHLLQPGAAIVLVSSAFHSKGAPGFSVYGATKSAIRALARSFAAELAPKQIRVNCISPGATETPMFGKLGMNDQELAQFRAYIDQNTPLARVSDPAETARAIVFLCTEATYVTGADLVCDGGLSQV